MKAQFAPMDIAMIMVVVFIGLMFALLLPTHLLERNLAVATKLVYTKNEADLALLSMLSTRYHGSSVYHKIFSNPNIIESNDFEKFFTEKLNETLGYKLKCYELIIGNSKVSVGKCSSFDYSVTYPMFSSDPSKLTTSITLKYEKKVVK